MRFTAERCLQAPPERVFSMVTEPALIKRWTDAPVRTLRPGHANHPTALGATRSVALPLGLQAVEQVVSCCDPPRAFGYQAVVSGVPGLRSYSGELLLTPSGAGTRLSWTLELLLSSPARALEPILRSVLTVWMRRQLDALQAQLLASPRAALVLPPIPDPLGEDLATALADARSVLAEQQALMQAMQAARDPKHWYLQLCQLTTQELLGQVEAGQLPHPAWALRLLSLQHGKFLRNLRRWLSPSLGAVEPQWQSAFTALDLSGEADSVCAVLTGLHLALRAQLEYDLPQTLAQMLRGGTAADCARFRADLYATSLALRTAVEKILAMTTLPHLPSWLQWSPTRLLGESLEFLIRRWVYDVVKQRGQAFERGLQLAQKAPPPGQPAGLPFTSRKKAACETAPDSELDVA